MSHTHKVNKHCVCVFVQTLLVTEAISFENQAKKKNSVSIQLYCNVFCVCKRGREREREGGRVNETLIHTKE